MAAWRRKALELFPDLRRDIQSRDYTIYLLYFDLLPMAIRARAVGDRETLRRIHSFADWCMRQRAKDLWNAAGVCFYEHLFDAPRDQWPGIASWLSPHVWRDGQEEVGIQQALERGSQKTCRLCSRWMMPGACAYASENSPATKPRIKK